MKQVLLTAVVAAVVAGAVGVVVGRGVPPRNAAPAAPAVDIESLAGQLADNERLAEKFAGPVLSYTEEPAEDAWVDGSRTPGTDHRSLAPTSNSICFLTNIEIKGIQSPEDSSACRIAVDDFTGFWQLEAEVGEGAKSQVRCNARCLTWE